MIGHQCVELCPGRKYHPRRNEREKERGGGGGWIGRRNRPVNLNGGARDFLAIQVGPNSALKANLQPAAISVTVLVDFVIVNEASRSLGDGTSEIDNTPGCPSWKTFPHLPSLGSLFLSASCSRSRLPSPLLLPILQAYFPTLPAPGRNLQELLHEHRGELRARRRGCVCNSTFRMIQFISIGLRSCDSRSRELRNVVCGHLLWFRIVARIWEISFNRRFCSELARM